MFSGLSSQISGFVSQKMGGAGAPPAEGGEGGEVPVEGGEGGEAQQGAGGPMGFAQGLMMKAAAVKEGVAAKAGELGAGNIQVSGLLCFKDFYANTICQPIFFNILGTVH